MDGAELLAYTRRLLGTEGVPDELLTAPVLYDMLTDARDDVQRTFASNTETARLVWTRTTLTKIDARNYKIPDATGDPMRVLWIRDPEYEEELAEAWDYEWLSLRQLRFREDYTGQTPEVAVVEHRAAIAEDTTATQIGLPTTLHRVVGKLAASMARATVSDAQPGLLVALFDRELARLEEMYEDFDASHPGSLSYHAHEGIAGFVGDMAHS